MMTMTAEAEQLFDQYLKTVRWSVKGVAGAGDIERDVREHVASALSEHSEPITSDTLREVLARLGDPWQWVPLEDLPMWRRALMRFWAGPEDWRLAYLCFGLTVLGLVLLPVGVGVFVFAGAYLLARATIELATERDSALGPRRWLVYPPLAAVAVLLFAALLAGPAAAISAWAIEGGGFRLLFPGGGFPYTDALKNGWVNAAAAAVIVGSWWIVLSALVAIAIRPVRWLFAPFASHLRRVHALWLTTAGAVLAVAGAMAFV